MRNLFWIGARESDQEYVENFFDGSVTLYGEQMHHNYAFCKQKNYRINHNHITDEQTSFMVETELELIKQYPDIQFMSYNPNLLYDCSPEVLEHIVCMNDERVMRFLDSKIQFREFAARYVNTLRSEKILGKYCNSEYLKRLFPDYDNWIIQCDIASGGYKTFLMSKSVETEIRELLCDEEYYLVSPYYEKNIPINIHAVIYKKDIMLTPGSVQIMGEDQDRLLYRGADYIVYRDIAVSVREKFENEVYVLCEQIQKLGYRGILGIDAIIVDDKPWILEVNNRFQASTILINKALQLAGLPSLHELNYESFLKDSSELIRKEELKDLSVCYSMYTFLQDGQAHHYKHILQACRTEKAVESIITDGYVLEEDVESDAYLYRVIFNTNISSITEDYQVRLHPNITAPSREWYESIISEEKDYKKIKISLLNQGVVLSRNVKKYLDDKGGMREGVYFSVDLTIDDKYIANAPLAVKLVALSPLKIDLVESELRLFYYGYDICKVKIDYTDKIAQLYTKKGVPIGRMCLLATDRLRVQNCDFCTFKEQHVPCRFCEAGYKKIQFQVDDICEGMDAYFAKYAQQPFRHILIGGLSNAIGHEKKNIMTIITHIREYSDMPIYLMCLPCDHVDDIDDYVDAGVTEIGFNIEIYDRELARKYMPGKGCISLERYKKALMRAVDLLGDRGAVRSAFIVGLESEESLLAGIEYVCKLGAAPILSVFRPIPDTDMQNVIPPENEWLLTVYNRVEEICSQYGLAPGPACPSCQNNTLAFDLLESERR